MSKAVHSACPPKGVGVVANTHKLDDLNVSVETESVLHVRVSKTFDQIGPAGEMACARVQVTVERNNIHTGLVKQI